MNDKYILNSTKIQLKKLREFKLKVLKFTSEQAKQELIRSGIYQKNGKLKSCYR